MFSRALVLVVLCLSFVARAQADQWAPLPPLPSPVTPVNPNPNPTPLPTDPIKAGVQFNGEFQGLVSGTGTSGLGVTTSVGLGLNRLAILFTPAVTVASSLLAVSLGLSVRIYLKSRQQGVLVGFLKPSAMVGLAGSSGFGSSGLLFGGLGFGGGGEYLLTRNLGITAELGLTFSSLGLGGGTGASAFAALTTVGSVGVMLHQ